MAQITIRIPQMGEGLREARFVAALKPTGTLVKKDEVLYQIETDKAILDVESPYTGTLTKWLAEPNQIMLIGADIAVLEVEKEINSAQNTEQATEKKANAYLQTPVASVPTHRLNDVPPRTRAYAKTLNIQESTLAIIPRAGKQLMPSDIDAWQKNTPKIEYQDSPLSSQQTVLNARMNRAKELVIPAYIQTACAWMPLSDTIQKVRSQRQDFHPSIFTLFCYAIAKTLQNHNLFRSTLTPLNDLRTYDHVHLGIAVARENDDLVLAVIEDADTLSWKDFAIAMKNAIHQARQGKDQASQKVTFTISNMQKTAVYHAVPVVVPPACATMVLTEPYYAHPLHQPYGNAVLYANVGLSFDHRIINGVAAGRFIKDVQKNIENLNINTL